MATRACECLVANPTDLDLLLTDWVLPGKVHGRELAERTTAMRPEVQVLLMSGYPKRSGALGKSRSQQK